MPCSICTERFDELISRSRLYVIQYDGTCYKLVDGEWKECKLEGSIEFFTELYLGQPHERDANDFAYERVKALLGASQGVAGAPCVLDAEKADIRSGV